MGETAELGAFARETTRVARFDCPWAVTTRYGIAFAVEGRDPERVDDVAARNSQLHFFANGQDKFVCGHDVGDAVVVEVVLEFPPPLLTDDHNFLDLTVIGCRHIVEFKQQTKCEEGDNSHNHGRQDRPTDFEASIAVNLLGKFFVCVQQRLVVSLDAETPRHVDHCTLHQHKDHGSRNKQPHQEGIELLSNRTLGVHGREVAIATTR